MKTMFQLPPMPAQPRRLGWVAHAIVWIVLFLFPFLFRGRESEMISLPNFLRFCIQITGTLAVFYVNYVYLVKRFLFTRQIWLYFLYNLLFVAVVFIATYLLTNLIPLPEIITPRRGGGRGPREFIHFVWLFDVIKYIFLVIFSVALKATGSWYQINAERKELEKQRSEAELQNLKNQLNPHFLFNTLNNIYSLIAINGEQAQESVHKLSRLLRYMLYDSAQAFVPLGKDIDFVRDYVELMRIRMPEHVELQTEIQIELPDLLIAPLLFISPVENAFKHGVSNSKPSFIHIKIVTTGNQIRCLIRNSFFPKDTLDKSGSGIGLINLQKRLDLLYPDNYKLTSEQSGETYSCELTLNLKQ